ncbi:MAG: 30S ribosomal protein S8 [Acidobacteria bacterium]|nr:30S ribosomal protein S8 [Acidobacteriota bacterium]
MTMTDPVSDLLTRIRNASSARHDTVDIPSSKMKLEIARIMKEEGYISGFTRMQDDKQGMIRIQLKYAEKNPVISSLERISRPGCRVYVGKSEIPSVIGGLGICIISTSQGILTGKQAEQKGLGGELLCTIS